MGDETQVVPSATVTVEPSKVIAATIPASEQPSGVSEAVLGEKIQIDVNEAAENMAVNQENDNNATDERESARVSEKLREKSGQRKPKSPEVSP